MNILVTGASGFLGGALAKALIQSGQNVRTLVRKTSNLNNLGRLPVDIVRGSLEDKASLIPALRDVDTVYHCAALSTDWAPWEAFYQANVQGVRNIVDIALRERKIQRFLHVSTTDVYGYPTKACDEFHPITDVGLPYNRSKGLGEQIVWNSYKKIGLPVTIIRPATIYGPRSKEFVIEFAKLLLKRKMALINKGKSPAGLLYIDNAVKGIIQAAKSPHTVGQIYNLRDETKETWYEYMEALAKGLKTPVPQATVPAAVAMGLAHLLEIAHRFLRVATRPLLTRHAVHLLFKDQCYSIKKARHDFGFQSTVTFSEGIEKTVSWLNKGAEGMLNV